MSTHISKLCGVPFYHLHNIKRIEQVFVSRVNRNACPHAFITFCVDLQEAWFGHSVQKFLFSQ